MTTLQDMSVSVYSNPVGIAMRASNGTLAFTGRALSITGPTTVNSPLTLTNALSIAGQTTLAAALTGTTMSMGSGAVAGTLSAGTLTASTLTVSGNASVTGQSTCGSVSAQTASVSGSVTAGTLTAGQSQLGTATLAGLTVTGPSVHQGAASFTASLTVAGGTGLQNTSVAGALNVTGQSTFATSLAQPMQIVGTATGATSTEILMDRSAAGTGNIASLRLTPSAGLMLTTNSLKGLTVSSTDQQVSVTANRSGTTFAVRGDGQISASTEILLDNTLKGSGQSALVGVDATGLYLSPGTAQKSMLINYSGNTSFGGNVVVPGTFQAAGAATFSSLNTSSLSAASITSTAIAASRITGTTGALALQGADSAQTVTVTNVLTVNNVQAKPGAALALSGQDAGLTTQIVGTLKVDAIGKRSANMVTVTDPLSASVSIGTPLLNLNGNPGTNQLNVTNTDSSANSDAAVAFNRTAFASGYTGLVGIRPNVGFFVQLGSSLAISTDIGTRTTSFAGGVSVAGAVAATGAVSVGGAASVAGALACASSASVTGTLSVVGSPATVQFMNGSSLMGTCSADSSFLYLRYIDANGVIADRLKVDRSGNFTMNGGLGVGGALSAGATTCSSLATASSNNTPAISLVGLSSTIAQVYADTSYLRMRFWDSNNTLQDRLLLDRSGNLTTQANASVSGALSAASAGLTGGLTVGGAFALTGGASFLGAVAITGSAPYALTLGPSAGAYASLSASSGGFTLQGTDGTTLQSRISVNTAGLVSIAGLSASGAITCAGTLSSGNISIAGTAPSVSFGQYGRVFSDSQFLHLQQWDGTNAPSDRLTISTTGLVTVPNGITTGTFVIGNDAGPMVQLRNSSGTSWGIVYADSSTLRLRSPDGSNTMQDRVVVGQGGVVSVPGSLSVAGGLSSSAALTVVAGTAVGGGAAYNLQAGSTISSCLYSEQGFLALQVQNSSGSLVNRATFDSFGNVKLLGPTAITGALGCTGVTVSSATPAIQLNNGTSAPFAQLSGTSGQVILAVGNGQGQLQNGIAFDTGANMTCPGTLSIGAISTTRLVSSGVLQAATSLTLTDPSTGGFGASMTHTGANSTPQLAFALADNNGNYTNQLTLTPGQAGMSALTLSNSLTVGSGATVGGTLAVTGPLVASSTLQASSQLSLLANSSTSMANLMFSTSNGGTVNTQVVSTPTYASFLQVTSGSGLTERMRFDNSSNILFNASLIPNTTSLTIGTQSAKWSQIWSVNTPNTTSDARLKKEVRPLPQETGLDFIEKLQPSTFKWVDEQHGTGTHFGFIAQQVAALVEGDKAIVTHPSPANGEYGLQYTGFIAPLVLAVQQLAERCRLLEAR